MECEYSSWLLLDNQAGSGKWKVKACSEERQREQNKFYKEKNECRMLNIFKKKLIVSFWKVIY